MCHDSSVLRYRCWRDWRDYMNEDSGVIPAPSLYMVALHASAF